jgi:hypothetical protein
MTYPTPGGEDMQKQREALLAHMIAGLPDKHKLALEVLNKVNGTYVKSGRDTVVKDVFDHWLAHCAAQQRYGRNGTGKAMYITGGSGAGKTDAVEHLLKTHPSMQPVRIPMGMVLPWVSVSLSGPATLANLGNAILAAAGYEKKGTIKQSLVWPMLPEELLLRGVSLIHIDETQHLMANKTETGELIDSLKGLMNSTVWPLRILLSGMPETNNMLLVDSQGERRNFSAPLPSLDLPDDLPLVKKIMTKLCDAAGLDPTELFKIDVPERVAHAAAYEFGRVCEVTAAAIYDAMIHPSQTQVSSGSKARLERDHFARAYILHSHARGHDGMNPFLIDGWSKLDAGYFIIDPDRYGT